MKNGETFSVQLGDKDYNYKVTEIQVMTPDDAETYSYTKPEKKEAEVVLITCTPYGFNTDRLLVIGHLESVTDIDNTPIKISLGKESLVSYSILGVGLFGLSLVALDSVLRRRRNNAQ